MTVRIRVFYDYDGDGVKPIFMQLKLAPNFLVWRKKIIYIPLEAPFERIMGEDFYDGQVSVSVQLDDLLVHADRPGKFGIHLAQIRARHADLDDEFWDQAELLLFRMCDLEEVLQLDVGKRFKW